MLAILIRHKLIPHVGVNGANNGIAADPVDAANPGEVSKVYQPSMPYSDEDYDVVHPGLPQGGDPAVLEFPVDVHSPGFLRLSFVFATDEYPAWADPDQPYNDSIAILIKRPCAPENSPGENIATFIDGGLSKPFSLHDLIGCMQLFHMNQMSPQALSENPNSPHKVAPPNGPEGYYTFYDHEFGGFSTVLTRETKQAIAPGQYTIKVVIEDAGDRKVDSALFIEAHSLKLYPIAPGDYNTDGYVDGGDYVIWRKNVGKANPSFSDGDGNGDCIVDSQDYDIWRAHEGNSDHPNWSADFNRDGCVDQLDRDIWDTYWNNGNNLQHCASRFEGDADGDGDVDEDDLDQWRAQQGSCGSGFAPLRANEGQPALSINDIPKSPDTDGNGVVDETDLAALDEIILGSDLDNYEERQAQARANSSDREPTLAEP
jgi:hypothetical protein